MATSARSIGFSLALCAAVVLASGAAIASDEKPHKPYAVWVVGDGEKDGRPTTVRWRDTMPDAAFKAAHPWRIEVTWRFKKDASGKVPREETERATDLDTTLEQEIDSDTATEVAGFSDGEQRVWMFYANDRAKVEAALDSMKHDDATLPISYASHEDRDWQGLQLVLGTVRETTR
jgi:hypothetical protein